MTRPQDHIVFVVDDDPGIRAAVSDLLASVDLQGKTFGSAAEYIAFPKPDVPTCVVLDMELPDLNGLELQAQISKDQAQVVFITGHGDIPSSVRAMKAGAVDFLTKPFDGGELVRAIDNALVESARRREEAQLRAQLQERLATLTPREREVYSLIASGLLNKQAAAELGISEVTLQIHRGNVMKKMRAESLADLVRMATALAIPVTHSRR